MAIPIAALALGLGSAVLGACGSDDTGTPPPTAATAPSSTTTSDPTVTPSPTSTATDTPGTTRPPETTPTTAETVLALPQGEPAWRLDFPDPFVLVEATRSYAYGTASGLVQVQRLDAPGLLGWSGPSDALPDLPDWAVPFSAWAPAVLELGDRYLLYYTAQVAGTEQHCIAVAVADGPEGPFVDAGRDPLVCPAESGGAIDPSPFVDSDGTVSLLWKNDGVTLRRESAIWSQRVGPDGTEVVDPPVRLIGTDQRWEYPHVEAPSMARVGDVYWLAYSGNWWNQEAYGVGLARCESPRGPCTKPLDGPVLRSRAGAAGPGGAEFFRDGTGRLLVAYHAWVDEVVGYPGSRALWLDRVDTSGEVPDLGPST